MIQLDPRGSVCESADPLCIVLVCDRLTDFDCQSPRTMYLAKHANYHHVRNSLKIDWTMRENVRAQLRVLVKRILRKYGYPPDKQEKATQTVLEQTEVLSVEWAIART